MARVSFSGIGKAFGETRVLGSVTLDIADGEFIALVGPSGCGKTTLLRILAGLEGQDQGEVRIGDRVIDDAPPKARDIAMVFQSYALYPYMSVRENIALPLVMRRLTSLQRLPVVGRFIGDASSQNASIEADVASVAQSLQIGHLLDRKPGQLSGGQRQRVALARAMVRKPAAFLMDEPLSNLDAKLRVQARAEIAELHRRTGGTFVYVTHDQVEAMTMADRVAVMMGGELLQVATPQDIYADPADIRVAEFIGAPKINILPGEVTRQGRIEVLGQTLRQSCPLPAGTPLSIGIRAEHMRIGTDDGLPAITRHVEHLGSDTFVYAEVAGMDERLVLRLPPERGSAMRIGDSFALDLHLAQAFAFGADGKRVQATLMATPAATLQMAS
ncbi:MAG: ABC transporter ATP-binding protein [Beijerinckiaceae bacterium]